MDFPIFISSEDFEIRYLLVTTSMSFIYIMNRNGPRTESCGTPLVTDAQSEAVPLMITLSFLLLSQFFFYLVVDLSINSKLFDLEH